MKIYLDNCSFNRPFDDQSYLTIRLETEVKLDIQEKIKSGRLSLGWPYILDFENDANPFIERRIEIQKWKEIADSFVGETSEILLKMNDLTDIGLRPLVPYSSIPVTKSRKLRKSKWVAGIARLGCFAHCMRCFITMSIFFNGR